MGARSPLARHRASPAELKARVDADRSGMPYLLYRDAADRQLLFRLEGAASRVSIGRGASNDVALEWDVQVSRVHAEIDRVGGEWVLVDDGMSSYGTFVDGVRISGRRRLRDGDEIRVGSTVIAFRAPSRDESRTTVAGDELEALPRLNETQRAVLAALARPFKESGGFATPATNRQIAADLVMSIDGVKSALRALVQKFDLGDVPDREKRVRLVERGFQLGVIAEDDL